MSQRLSEALLDDIAKHAAFYWQRKGIKSYTFDEMYQDAAEAALRAARRWEPKRGSLRGYCFVAAKNEIHHRATRAIAPVSARGHDQTEDLGKVKKLSLDQKTPHNSHHVRREKLLTAGHMVQVRRTGSEQLPHAGSPEHLDFCAWRGRVRIRMLQLLGDMQATEIEVAMIVLELGLDVATSMGYDRAKARCAAAKVRRRVQNDRKLYQLAREMP